MSLKNSNTPPRAPITDCTYANISESSITAYVNNLLPFSSWPITSNFSLILIVFRRFSTCITLGDAYLRFGPKVNDDGQGITQAMCSQCTIGRSIFSREHNRL
jgi:hypothetical protein